MRGFRIAGSGASLWAALLICLTLPSCLEAQSNPTGQFDLTTFPQPYFLLLRDPAVHAELKLDDAESDRLMSLCYAQDEAFWKLRGMSREQAMGGLRKLTAALRQSAESMLSKAQVQRLAQIQLQLAGFGAFLQPQVVAALSLSQTQTETIEEAVQEFQDGYQKLRKRQADGERQEQLDAEATKLRSELRETMQATLAQDQQSKWGALVGARVDASKLGKVKFKAPPLNGATGWVNTQPLGAEQLRGHVVALHFYAYRCINCKRNQPWYRQWQSELQPEGLIVLGIHTPEVASEREPDNVRQNAATAGLQYPIVLDNDKTLWNAWGNTLWPSTYLIDKDGFVRYWWLGELNWKGAGMQETFKQHINTLLKE